MHILVADDEAPIAELLSSVCMRGGHQVALETSSSGVLAYLAAHRVDLLVADLEMPGLSTMAFLRAVRSCQPGLPVMATITHEEPLIVADLFGGGAVDVLRKPFGMDDLAVRIALVEEKRRYARDLAAAPEPCQARPRPLVASDEPAGATRSRSAVVFFDRFRDRRRRGAA